MEESDFFVGAKSFNFHCLLWAQKSFFKKLTVMGEFPIWA
jgi:hypothetical protein